MTFEAERSFFDSIRATAKNGQRPGSAQGSHTTSKLRLVSPSLISTPFNPTSSTRNPNGRFSASTGMRACSPPRRSIVAVNRNCCPGAIRSDSASSRIPTSDGTVTARWWPPKDGLATRSRRSPATTPRATTRTPAKASAVGVLASAAAATCTTPVNWSGPMRVVEAENPGGSPVSSTSTGPLKPSSRSMVTVAGMAPPWGTLGCSGSIRTRKSGSTRRTSSR